MNVSLDDTRLRDESVLHNIWKSFESNAYACYTSELYLYQEFKKVMGENLSLHCIKSIAVE